MNAATPAASPARGAFSTRATKWARSVHRYAGLLMLPWLLFFGMSGMLFNHPNLGQPVEGRPLAKPALAALTPWRAGDAAGQVLAALNEAHADKGGTYRLDPDFAPELEGVTVLGAPAPDGRYMVLLDMETPRGVLVTRHAPLPDGSSFPATALSIPQLSVLDVEHKLATLLRDQHMPSSESLKVHPKIHPELRLRVVDANDQRWNLTFDTHSGLLTGRKSDAFPRLGLPQLLAKMHTTHHFPLKVQATFFWALFEDLLGVTMVIWSITGIVMWWQMKRTRIAGLVSLAVALGIAGLIMSGTVSSLTFGDVKPAMGPGE